MFKISAIQNIEEQKEAAALCSAAVRDGYFAYVMRDCDTGEIMGFSQFEIGAAGYISDLRPAIGTDDFEAMFILGRTTMNFIDMCGAHICRASENAADEKLLRAIGFKRYADGYSADMTGMFDGSHCSGEAVKLSNQA